MSPAANGEAASNKRQKDKWQSKEAWQHGTSGNKSSGKRHTARRQATRWQVAIHKRQIDQ